MTDEELATRMLAAAIGYNEDAEILAESFESSGDSSPLLTTLSLEILLKCARLLDRGQRKTEKGGHNYSGIWAELSAPAKSFILDEALARSHTSLATQPVEAVLDDLQRAFVLARYPYDILKNESEAEIVKRGEDWEAAGAPLDKADFRFHPEEAMTLIHGLRTWIEAKLK